MSTLSQKPATLPNIDLIRLALDQSLDAVTILRSERDASGKIVDFVWEYANDAAAHVLRQPRAALVGRRLLEVLPGNRQSGLFERYVSVVESGNPLDGEVAYDSEGIRGWFHNMAVKIGDGVAVFFRDVSEARRTASALQEREAWFSIALETARLGAWDVDLASGTMRCSGQCKANFGLPPDAGFTHDDFLAAIIPDDRAMVEAAIAAAIGGDGNYDVEFRIAWPDGDQHWINARGRCLYDDEGTPTRMVGVTLDITERKEAERDATRTQSLHAVMAAMGEAMTPEEVASAVLSQGLAALGAVGGWVLRLTADGGALEVIGAAGYPPELVEQWRVTPLTAAAPVAEAVRRGQPIWIESLEERLRRYPAPAASDQVSTGTWVAMPLLVEGKPVGGIGLSFAELRPIGDEDRAFALALSQQCAQALHRVGLYHQAQAAVRSRDELLSMLSHDLKNPLGAIIGSAQYLRRRMERGEVKLEQIETLLNRIEQAGQRMIGQLDELTMAANLASGQGLELYRRPTDLLTLVRQIIDEHQQQTAIPIRCETTVATLTAEVDELQLARVLGNLLVNAIKYSPSGGEIRISLSEAEGHGGPWAVISVSDQGIGIPAADLPYIFEPYRRASNVRERTQGTGLGLASARRIVALHGGSITVVSRLGRGSTFTVRLPLSPLEE